MSDKLMEAFEFFLRERTRLTSAKQEAAKSYDQTILTFSGGAIGLSITFLKEIAPRAQAPGLLYTSWIFFAVAMLATLYSLLASQRASEDFIADLEARYSSLVSVDKAEEVTPAKETQSLTRFGVTVKWFSRFKEMLFVHHPSPFGSLVKWLNRLAALFFIVGVLFFGWFARQNWVSDGGIHEREQQRQTATRH